MKKKFLCLFLVMMMLVTVLASCSSNEDNLGEELEENQARLTKTLVMYMMSEEKVATAVEVEIEEAINELTKAKFKTQIDLKFFTPDEYYKKLETAIKEQEKEYNKKKKEEQEVKDYNQYLKESCVAAGLPVVTVKPAATTAAATEDETIYNKEYGILEYKYPETTANQVNIFYLGGYEKYSEYVDNDWLEGLDSEVEYTSKKLKEHIPAVYMENLAAAGIYGIPNNSLIGNYKWLLLNKELMTKYIYEENAISNIDPITDAQLGYFLKDVAAGERDANGNLLVRPIAGELEPTNMFYWSYDENLDCLVNKPSILGTYCNNNAALGTELVVRSIFEDTKYTSQLTKIQEFKDAGYFAEDADSNLPFAMSIVEGSFDLKNKYEQEGYYVKMVEAPKVDNTQIYDNMFCISRFASLADTDNTKRCMEIITYIDTNEEIRNLLQYGIEDKHYTIDSEGVLNRIESAGYVMDINKTGNIFMAHPEDGMPADFWDQVGMDHCENLQINPTSGFVFDSSVDGDVDSFVRLIGKTNEYMEKLNNCKNLEELTAEINNIKAILKADSDYIKVTKPLEPEIGQAGSLAYLYQRWLIDNGYVEAT